MTNNASVSDGVLAPINQIIFIDSQVENYQFLVEGVLPGIEIIILDRDRDGIKQITTVLNQGHDFTTVHLVSHGSPSCLYLGNSKLSLDTINQYGGELRSWFPPNFNLEQTNYSLILYGCNVAAGDMGEKFILKLCILMNAEISASSTPIGNPAKGGNWEFDRQTMTKQDPIIFSE